jgi:hypothetical protein
MQKSAPLKKVLFVFSLTIFLMGHNAFAQNPEDTKDINSRAPNPKSMSRNERKAQEKKVKQKQLVDKAIDKGRKRHEKLQTKEVRKRMKKSKQTAAANNAHKREFFLKRWFTKKHRTKNR